MTPINNVSQNQATKPAWELPAWQLLRQHFRTLQIVSMNELFAADLDRFAHFSLEAAGLFLDYSKNHITAQTMHLLVHLANACRLKEKITGLFAGEIVNSSEAQPALHTALRHPQTSAMVNGTLIAPLIVTAKKQMFALAESLRAGTYLGATGEAIRDVVHIGIGGSELGPRLVCEALQLAAKTEPRIHFVANMDPEVIEATLQRLQPASTLFILASKSFTTEETLANGTIAKQWLIEAMGESASWQQHFVAITEHSNRAESFGVPKPNILPLWSWVGGRYSVWSTIGLPIAISSGCEQFDALLRGASTMDEHFLKAPLAANMPVILALLGIWYHNFHDAQSTAVIPYAEALVSLPDYLQQLVMESNGKNVRHDAGPVEVATSPIVWGGTGTNSQHAYFQLLHQGAHLIPADFILPLQSRSSYASQHQHLIANCLAQAQVLLCGKSKAQLQAQLRQQGFSLNASQALAAIQALPGNRPSNTILMPQLTAENLGALLALYEHKTFVQSVLWDINAFDQWGVQWGKEAAKALLPALESSDTNDLICDASTRGLINRVIG